MLDAFIDSCAFDPKCSPQSESSLEIFQLHEANEILLQIPYPAEKEINHPHTPEWVKKKALEFVYTIETSLTFEEKKLLAIIEAILSNGGKIDNIKNDARNIFEAQKDSASFITTDKRLLGKQVALKEACSIALYLPSEFLAYFKRKKKEEAERIEKMKLCRERHSQTAR